jgi:L-rhamnose-H+ transport protein
MSACFSYGLAAGDPIKKLALEHGTTTLWQGLPVLVPVLLGGFTTNFIWCVILHVRNGSAYQYLSPMTRNHFPGKDEETIIETAIDAPGEQMAERIAVATANDSKQVPLFANYLFSGVAGVTWYFQFFFYTMGETQMGAYKFSSWTLHMASIIIFSTLWGLGLKEWKGASSKTMRLLFFSLLLLIASTVIVGYGNYLGEK